MCATDPLGVQGCTDDDRRRDVGTRERDVQRQRDEAGAVRPELPWCLCDHDRARELGRVVGAQPRAGAAVRRGGDRVHPADRPLEGLRRPVALAGGDAGDADVGLRPARADEGPVRLRHDPRADDPSDRRREAARDDRPHLARAARAEPRVRLEPGRVRDVRPGAARARRALRLRPGVARHRAHDLAIGGARRLRRHVLPPLRAHRPPGALRRRAGAGQRRLLAGRARLRAAQLRPAVHVARRPRVGEGRRRRRDLRGAFHRSRDGRPVLGVRGVPRDAGRGRGVPPPLRDRARRLGGRRPPHERHGHAQQRVPGRPLRALPGALHAGHGGYPLIGSPDQVADELERISQTGMAGIAFGMCNFLEEMPFFVQEVLPRLEAKGLRRAAAPRSRIPA